MTSPSTPPNVGDTIIWNGLECEVTRVAPPTFPGFPPLIYARPWIEGDDAPSQSVPDGEWKPLIEEDIKKFEDCGHPARDTWIDNSNGNLWCSACVTNLTKALKPKEA